MKVNMHILNHEPLRKIVSNTSWLFLEKFFRLLLGLTVSVWVAKYLGPEKFGELTYALTIIAFFQIISKMGLDSIVVRELSKENKDENKLLCTVCVARSVMGLISWLFVILLTYITDTKEIVILVILAGSSLLFQSTETIDLWYQSKSKSKKTVIIKVFTYITSNVIKIICILSSAPLWVFSALFGLEVLLTGFGLIISFKKMKERFHLNFDVELIKELLRESWPYILSGLSIIIYMRIDQIMVRHILGDKALGIYSVILPLSNFWQFIPIALSTSISPFIAKKKEISESEYYKALYNAFKIFALIGWSISITTYFLSGYVVDFMYGGIYDGASNVLAIHIFVNLFICMGVAHALWMVNEKKSKLSIYKTIIGAVVCVVGNYIVIDDYGIVGVAAMAVLSQAFATLITDAFFTPKIFFMQIRAMFMMPLKIPNAN